MLTPDQIFNFLTHLIAMNSHSTATVNREKSNAEAIPESCPDSPAPTVSSELSEPTSELKGLLALVQKMTQIQVPHPVMTCSPLQAKFPQPVTEPLDPDIPINYNETLLKHLYRRLQIRTLHNVSKHIPRFQ